MFCTAYFSIIYNSWDMKQPKCPLMEDNIEKSGLSFQRNIIQPQRQMLVYKAKWKELKGILVVKQDRMTMTN